jgi:hypothetical protein
LARRFSTGAIAYSAQHRDYDDHDGGIHLGRVVHAAGRPDDEPAAVTRAYELGDDGAHDGEAERDLQAGEDPTHGRGDDDLPGHGPGLGAEDLGRWPSSHGQPP